MIQNILKKTLGRKACFSAGIEVNRPLDILPGAEEIRVLLLGDWGSGSIEQKNIAEKSAVTCDQLGCDLVLMMGDNFIQHGVENHDDPQFQEKFDYQIKKIEKIYSPKKFFKSKYQEQIIRYSKFNLTEFNLEPDLKESPGCIRDMHVWDLSIDQILKLLPLSQELLIHILIETVWNGFCYKPEQFRDYIDAINSPWVQAYYDIGNMQKYLSLIHI